MTLVVPSHGDVDMLGNIVNKVVPENLVLRLFTNNITPAETDTVASYTEASGSGYGAITLPGAGWTVTAATPSYASYAQQAFIFTGALGNVYGYYLTRVTSGRIAWAERFTDGPYTVNTTGTEIRIPPRITLT